MVVSFLARTSFTGYWQDLTASPSTRTVQAPQIPSPQPYFVPVSPSSVRRTQRSMRSGSTSRLTGRPLISKRMVSFMSVPSLVERFRIHVYHRKSSGVKQNGQCLFLSGNHEALSRTLLHRAEVLRRDGGEPDGDDHGGDPLKSFDVLGQPEVVIVGGKVHRF